MFMVGACSCVLGLSVACSKEDSDDASGDTGTSGDSGATDASGGSGDGGESSGDDGDDEDDGDEGGDDGGPSTPPVLYVYEEFGEEIGAARAIIELPDRADERIFPGDFDGDGVVDVLCADRESVIVFGAGGDAPSIVDVQDMFPDDAGYSVTDLDGDGRDDVFRHVDMETAAAVLWSEPQGGFSLASLDEFDPGVASSGVAFPSFGDLDADGNLDMAMWYPGGLTEDDERVCIATFVGDGARGFELVPIVPLAPPDVGLRGYYCNALTLADVDGDENVDLLLLGSYVSWQEGDDLRDFVAVYRGRGDGTLETMEQYPLREEYTIGGGRFGDIDRDGHIDAVVYRDDALWVSRGHDDGSFASLEVLAEVDHHAPGPPSDNSGSFAMVDVNGDGVEDIAWATEGAAGHVPGQEDGTMGAPIVGPTDHYYTSWNASADIDGDGDHEILAVMSDY
jgi:hypothetical protein